MLCKIANLPMFSQSKYPSKFSTARVLCYTVGDKLLCDEWNWMGCATNATVN